MSDILDIKMEDAVIKFSSRGLNGTCRLCSVSCANYDAKSM